MKKLLFVLTVFLLLKNIALSQTFANGDIVHIYCLGHIDGPRYLNGSTSDGVVNMSTSTEYPTTGVKWKIERTQEGFINLRCMGHIDGVRYLNGNTIEGVVNMSNELVYPTTGTRWTLVRKKDGNYHIKCEGHIDGIRYLNGNTVTGEVNLSNELVFPTTGTSWRISKIPLAIPVQLSPTCGSSFDIFPRRTTLQWRAVPGSATYVVEIDCFHCCESGKWCTDLGKTWQIKKAITGTNYTFDYVGAQPGRWRVWAVDASGREGEKSAWCEFTYTR